MEDAQKTTSRFRRAVHLLLFVAAGAVWLAELSYLISARGNLTLPMSWPLFLGGAFAIQIFFVPALILHIPRDRFSPRRILIAFWLILTVSFWVFAPLYEYLALYDNSRAGIIAIMTNYLWEIPLIGALFILPLYRYFLRIIRAIPTLEKQNADVATRLRRSLIYFPMRAGIATIVFAAFALLVAYIVALPVIMPPKREIVKNTIDVMTMGFMAAIFTFFVQSTLIRPWLEKLAPPPYKKGDGSP